MSTDKPDSDLNDIQEPILVPEDNSPGEIRINHDVVASIVRIATKEVPGVFSVGGGGFRDDVVGIFTKKESGGGVRVELDDEGDYHIEIRVILNFGVQLAKTAYSIQAAVREQVERMTDKSVAKVNVTIDAVQMPQPPKESPNPKGTSESPLSED